MALKFLKHKWQKVVLAGLLVFTVLLLALAFFVNSYWSPILANKIKGAVASSTDSLYTINFSEAQLHVLKGRIIIYNIDLKVDSAVYQKRKAAGLAPNNLIDLHVDRLVLSHIHPFTLYFRKKLDIGRIVINSPRVHVSYQLNHTKDTVADKRTLYQKISQSLKSVHVGDIFFNNVSLKYSDYSGKELVVSEVKEMNFQANELLIDSATQTDTSRFLYCKEVVTEINNYKGASSSGLYNYSFKRLKLSTLTSQLTIKGFALIPIEEDAFFAKTKTDRFTIRLDSIQLNNFDYLSYHKYRKVSASSLKLSRGVFNLFNNPNKTQTNENKVKSFPNVGIYKTNTDLKLDTIAIRHLDITYSEFNKKSQKAGTITFGNTRARLLNVTTNKEALQKNNIATVAVTTNFMNQGGFECFFTFNLTDKLNSYSYKGHLGAMDMQRLNPATMPLAMVKVASGTLKSFDFDIKGNNKVSYGPVTILYNDLKVNLMKAGEPGFNLKKKLIESMYANIFILKHNNPDQPGLIPRKFNVRYVRPINSPFFKTAWKTLLTGLKPAVGLDDKTQKATQALMDKKSLDKKNKDIKKEQRLQRRNDRKMKRQIKKGQKEIEKVLEKAEE